MKKTLLALSLSFLLTAQAAEQSPEIDRSLPVPSQTVIGKVEAGVVLAAQRYAAFWNTGEARFAEQALADDFTDLNLPSGRIQGPKGPLAASQAFRQAVPDLKAKIERLIATDDQVVVHLRFTGTYSGIFKGKQGKGQKVDFQAVDIYQVVNGKIKTNWHLEDNLSLLLQLEAISFNN